MNAWQSSQNDINTFEIFANPHFLRQFGSALVIFSLPMFAYMLVTAQLHAFTWWLGILITAFGLGTYSLRYSWACIIICNIVIWEGPTNIQLILQLFPWSKWSQWWLTLGLFIIGCILIIRFFSGLMYPRKRLYKALILLVCAGLMTGSNDDLRTALPLFLWSKWLLDSRVILIGIILISYIFFALALMPKHIIKNTFSYMGDLRNVTCNVACGVTSGVIGGILEMKHPMTIAETTALAVNVGEMMGGVMASLVMIEIFDAKKISFQIKIIIAGIVGLCSINLLIYIPLIVSFASFGTIGMRLFIPLQAGKSIVALIAGSLSGIVAGSIGGIVAVIVMIILAGGTGGLSLLGFCVITSVFAYVLGSYLNIWLGLTLAVLMMGLGWQQYNGQIFIVFPFMLLAYYRIVPDYIFFSLLNFIVSQRDINRSIDQLCEGRISRIIGFMPPYSSEISWLPLPTYADNMVLAYRNAPAFIFNTLQRMYYLPASGLQKTVKLALPGCVAAQLGLTTSLGELISVEQNHFRLAQLVPAFYQYHPITNGLAISKFTSELYQLFPDFQRWAQDVAAAMANDNIELRKRGLEAVLKSVQTRQGQLPGMNFKQPQRVIAQWSPAFARWQSLLQTALDQLNQAPSEVGNFFMTGNPVPLSQTQLFKGRNAFADEVVRAVFDRSRPTVVLHGPRRCGKTSFLKHLPRLLPSEILPVYVDLQDPASTQNVASFCYNLAYCAVRDCAAQGVKLPPAHRADFMADGFIAMQDWLDAALPILGQRRILLNLDEFENLGTAISQGRLNERVLSAIRSWVQHREALCFIFSGVQTLDEMGPNWSNYFISVQPMEMLYLEPEPARDLLLHPDPAFDMQYGDDTLEQILRVTHCHPYLLNLVGSCAVKQVNMARTRTLTAPLLQAALTDSLTQGLAFFHQVWSGFYNDQRQFAAEIGEIHIILLQVANGQPFEMRNAHTAVALRRLLRVHVLQRSGEVASGDTYAFEVPLIARWVRERAIDEG